SGPGTWTIPGVSSPRPRPASVPPAVDRRARCNRRRDEARAAISARCALGSRKGPLVRHPSTVSRGRFRAPLLLAAACGLGAARDAAGAGFALFERSARGLGSAFAGEVAVAEDASTIAYNPAGLTLLHGTQLTSSLDAVIPSFHFHNEGSRLNPVVGGGPLRGNDGGNAGET